MSKQRPSEEGSLRGAAPAPAPAPPDGLAYWMRRVYRNSYTRGGRRRRVRGWSVKIQHGGLRRTIALGAVPRAQAARRAAALYGLIRRRGWAAVPPPRRQPPAPPPGAQPGARPGLWPAPEPAAMMRARFWRRRLLRRPYGEGLRADLAGGLSVRIEHGGVSHYLPLGTPDASLAARRAAGLYRAVAAGGWPRILEAHPREITAAIFWAANPLACTYTTLFTAPPGPDPLPPRAARTPGGLACVVEPEGGVRGALVSGMALPPHAWQAVALTSGEEAIRLCPQLGPALVLVNRSLPDMAGSACAEALRARHPDLPVFTYGIYRDSDQLFLSFGGVEAGYVLRRRPPARLLEPLGPPGAARRAQIDGRLRRYFQEFFSAPVLWEETAMARLTPREGEILEALSQGFVNKEIAQRLGISVWTVHGHLRSIFEKLRVHTRTEAVVRYLQK